LSNESPAEAPVPVENSAYRSGGIGSQMSVPARAVPAPRRRFEHKLWKHILLFVLTLATTTVAGAGHYRSFLSDFGRQAIEMGALDLLIRGFWYSGTLLLILGAHEMGHYSYCRRYNIDATLPYFLPFLFFTGTLGAVIRIREAFPTRTVLFDIGVAGPIAGFMVVVPALFVGLSLSTVTVDPPGSDALLSLGEPLLFQWGAQLVFGRLPEGHTINMHPMVFASWFGMLATALNLLPFGQLDGGHITYATLGRWATPISLLTVAGAIAMTFVSTSWLFFTILMVLMLLVLGPRHPRVVYEYEPLGRGRVAVAAVALLMLVLCFTPAPIEPYELISTPQIQSVSR
jgi:membrane-associated protease RseP (regulator of RpoE activity)